MVWGLACGASPEPPAPTPPSEVGATAARARPGVDGRPAFRPEGLAEAPLCRPEAPGAPEDLAPVVVQPWTGPGVSAATVEAVGESAQQVWARLGLRLDVRPPRTLPAGAPDRLFTSSDTTSPSAPLRSLLAQLPDVPGEVPLVVLAHFLDGPSSGTTLRGLTLPRLTLPGQGGTTPQTELPVELADLPPRSMPVVFIDAGVGPRAPGDLSLAPAHELGHALGLAHRTETTALMSSGPLSLRCVPAVSAAEWETVRTERSAWDGAAAVPGARLSPGP